jgi:hypothetical protein
VPADGGDLVRAAQAIRQHTRRRLPQAMHCDIVRQADLIDGIGKPLASTVAVEGGQLHGAWRPSHFKSGALLVCPGGFYTHAARLCTGQNHGCHKMRNIALFFFLFRMCGIHFSIASGFILHFVNRLYNIRYV